MKTSNKPFFSIIIPTLNEEKFLPFLLKDLQRQTFKDFEVLVIDAQSEDKTLEKVTKFSEKLLIHAVTAEKRNVSFQRNLGVKEARAKWVIFMDADNRIPPYFIEGIKYQLAKHKNTDVFSTFVSIKEKSAVNKTIEQGMNVGMVGLLWLEKPWAVGALIGSKKNIFEKIQFSEDQKFLEDSLFIKTVHEFGYTFSLFREPRFYYSLRRFKKEGNLKMLQTTFKYQLHYLRGGDFSKPIQAKEYPMLGGMYYSKSGPARHETWMLTISNFIKNASQKQLEQARSILNSFRDMEF